MTIATPTSNQRFPLSSAQRRVWFLHRLNAEDTVYNMGLAIDIAEPVDQAALGRALIEVAKRHDILRTIFPEVDGEPVQVVTDTLPQLAVVDLGALTEPERSFRIAEEKRRATGKCFHVLETPPLQATLIRAGGASAVLVVLMHHILSDGWSLDLLAAQLCDGYRAIREGTTHDPGRPALQYADFAISQQDWLLRTNHDADIAYWKGKLAGDLPLLELPFDHPRAAALSSNGAEHRFRLSPGLSARLRAAGRQCGTTLYTTLLSVFNLLLARYSGQTDLVVGTPVANRPRVELEQLLGFFVSTVVLRTDLSGDPTVRTLLQRVHNEVLDSMEHQDFPFDKVVELVRPERSRAHSPIFQALFALQDMPGSQSYEVIGVGAHFELSLFMRSDGDGISGKWEYNTDLFEPATIERMTGHFVSLAEGIAGDVEGKISAIPILSAAERTQLLEDWNATATAYPRDATVTALFEEQVRATPDAIALVIPPTTGSTSARLMTYGELDRAANRLADQLEAMGVGPGSHVATMLDRSAEFVASILATLKAGGVYVPMDAASPPNRVAEMLVDANVAVVLTSPDGRARVPDTSARIVVVDDLTAPTAAAAATATARPCGVTAGDPAYVMFTSGSTGRPRAVEVPHRAIVRLVRNTNYITLSERAVILSCAPVSFDASTFELWGALLNGGRLVMYPGAIPEPGEIADLVRAWGVTTMWLTAGLFHVLVESKPEALTGLRQLLAGGDVLSPSHVARALQALEGGVLINGYGPTENTTFTCCHVMTGEAEVGSTVPIGRPIANTRVYVLDAAMQPVPVGVRGELWTGGDGVALGYRNDPDLTMERFRADPFSHDPSARIYRTGDLVRYRPDGVIEFVGRSDRQVKVRGFRIELGEIEHALRLERAVSDAVVVATERSPGNKRLVAYVVPAADCTIDLVALRTHLAARLPDYAMPSAIVPIGVLPLTRNGKVDTAQLAEPPEERREGKRPQTALETQLLAVWERVLGVKGIGIRDNFFELGGNSLLGVRLFASLEKILGKRIPVSVLFEGQTIETMAVALQRNLSAVSFSAVRIQRGTNLAPLFMIPGVDGNVIGYETLARSLGADLPVYGLRSVGLDGEASPRDSVEGIADAFLPEILKVQPTGPYRLAGLCMGGIIAFEIAQRITARGEQVQMLALIDTAPPNVIPIIRRRSRSAHQLEFLGRGVTRHLRAMLQRPPWQWPGHVIQQTRDRGRHGCEARHLSWRHDRAQSDTGAACQPARGGEVRAAPVSRSHPARFQRTAVRSP